MTLNEDEFDDFLQKSVSDYDSGELDDVDTPKKSVSDSVRVRDLITKLSKTDQDAVVLLNTYDGTTLHGILDVAGGYLEEQPVVVLTPRRNNVADSEETEGMAGL